MISLKRTLIKLFKENAQLRQDYVKSRLNDTEESGECEILMLLFMKLAYSSLRTNKKETRRARTRTCVEEAAKHSRSGGRSWRVARKSR